MRWRPVVARVGIVVMVALVLAMALLLTFGRVPPLLALGTSGTAVASIAGFRYYLTRRGHQ